MKRKLVFTIRMKTGNQVVITRECMTMLVKMTVASVLNSLDVGEVSEVNIKLD